MAGNDTSEEKSLPASPRKIKDLRKKGQIPRSTDMVTGISAALSFFFLIASSASFIERFKLALRNPSLFASDDITAAGVMLTKAMMLSIGPLLIYLVIIIMGTVLISNLIVNKGFIFSLDLIKFDFNKLNVVEGLKRFFSLKNLVELCKTVVKSAILISIVATIFIFGIRVPFLIPFCGIECMGPTFYYLVFPIIVASIAIYLVSGFLDMYIQTWLFLRDQRMSKSEAKKEQKTQEGSPETRAWRKRDRSQLLRQISNQAERPTLVIEGFSTVVSMRFVRFQMQLPIVMAKGKGTRGAAILSDAHAEGTPIHYDDEFATQLFRKTDIGSALPEALFEAFIRAMKATKQI